MVYPGEPTTPPGVVWARRSRVAGFQTRPSGDGFSRRGEKPSGTTPQVKNWLLRHPRFHLHFTPTSSSWLSLVKRWFAN